MSFPTIPDINLDKEPSRDEAMNLLLSSIALEEIGLTNLLDVEIKKAEAVLEMSNFKQEPSRDAIDINRSIEKTVQNVIRLYMLLQFKLDNVLELVPEKPSPTCGKPAEPPGAPAAPAGCVPLVKEAPVTASCDPLAQDAPAPAGSTISAEPADSEKSIPSSAMHAAEPVAPSGTPIDITQNIASDSASSDSNPKPGVEAVKQSDTLTRLIKGNITNGKDTLSNGSVIVEFNISQRKAPDLKNKLFYMFHQYNNECETAEYMCALPASISLIQLTLHNKLTLYNTIPGLRNPDITIVRGLGIAMKEDLEYGVVENQASFILCIINTKLNEIYRMIMYSPDSKLNHDSGFFKPSNERFSTNKL